MFSVLALLSLASAAVVLALAFNGKCNNYTGSYTPQKQDLVPQCNHQNHSNDAICMALVIPRTYVAVK